jgi:hypothetical protein
MTEHVKNIYKKCALGSDVVSLGEQLLTSGVNVTPAAARVRHCRAVAALRKSCGAHLLKKSAPYTELKHFRCHNTKQRGIYHPVLSLHENKYIGTIIPTTCTAADVTS